MRDGTQLRRNVARDGEQRKRNFAAALALAGMSQMEFAERNGIDASHLSKALNGHRPLTGGTARKVDAFIAKHLKAEAA